MTESISIRVRACVLNTDGLLLLIKKRVEQKLYWLVPGGGIEDGETPIDAIIREVREETGIDGLSDHQFIGCRECLVRGFLRTYELYFISKVTDKTTDLTNLNSHMIEEGILEVLWLPLDQLREYDVRPTFLGEFINITSNSFVSEILTPLEYVNIYGYSEVFNQNTEIVHVMLKPDALEYQMEDNIIKELVNLGGTLLLNKRMRLTKEQLELIYYDFSYDKAKKIVFDYLTSRETEHLVFIGPKDIHKKFNQAKGTTGTGKGIRGKYITWFTPLTTEEWNMWLGGKLQNQEQIDLEMFCRNLLHIANNHQVSINGLKSILSAQEFDLLKYFV